VPRRQPQEPKLPVTLAGRRQLPNSEAELAAHSKAMAGYNKEKAKYDEGVEYHGRSRGLKRSHHDHNSTNNGNRIDLSGLNPKNQTAKSTLKTWFGRPRAEISTNFKSTMKNCQKSKFANCHRVACIF
jgi:hypothetical protein